MKNPSITKDLSLEKLWQLPIVQVILMLPSWVFACIAYARLLLYNSGVRSRASMPVTVISVGNLTVGGTGKTPVTVGITSMLLERGHRVAILSRGYRSKDNKNSRIVCDGKNVLLSPSEAGDEPYMMATSLGNAVVISGKSRVNSAKLAIESLECDILILDDGFQHLALMRDIDIVLIDYNDDAEQARLLPAGRYREPLGALGRASHIIITKVPVSGFETKLSAIRNKLEKHTKAGTKISACRFKPARLMGADSPDMETLAKSRIIATCGIARPDQFKITIEEMGLKPCLFKSFEDHHNYSKEDAITLRNLLSEHEAAFLLTTEKDYVKLAEFEDLSPYLVAVSLQVEWLDEPIYLDIHKKRAK